MANNLELDSLMTLTARCKLAHILISADNDQDIRVGNSTTRAWVEADFVTQHIAYSNDGNAISQHRRHFGECTPDKLFGWSHFY